MVLAHSCERGPLTFDGIGRWFGWGQLRFLGSPVKALPQTWSRSIKKLYNAGRRLVRGDSLPRNQVGGRFQDDGVRSRQA